MAEAKKMRLNTFAFFNFFYFTKRKNTAYFDINWIITIFFSYLRFFRVKMIFLYNKETLEHVNVFRQIFFAKAIFEKI